MILWRIKVDLFDSGAQRGRKTLLKCAKGCGNSLPFVERSFLFAMMR